MRHLYLLLISASLVACTKENSERWTTVNVHCMNALTGESIDGIYFALHGQHKSSERSDYHGNFEPNNGLLSYSFKAKSNYDYILYHPKAHQYFHLGDDDPVITAGEENNFVYRMVEVGHLKLTIENIDCEWDDHLRWKITYTDKPEYPTPQQFWDEHVWDGCYGLETPFDGSVPAGHYALEWELTEVNGNENSGIESVFVPEGGEAEINFEY